MPLAPANPDAVLAVARPSANILTLSLPFLRFARVPIGGRATIARLPSSSALAVFSPIALTPAVHAALRALCDDPAAPPPVRYIIAPDIEHHLFLAAWKDAFPNAKVLGPAGLPEKRAASGAAHVPFAAVYTPQNKLALKIDDAFDSAFAVEYVHAHANRELVFLHRADRTLIQADLIFNLPPTEQYSRVPPAEYAAATSGINGLLFRFFSAFNHTGADGQSMFLPRIWQYYIVAKDRDAYRDSIRRIAQWDFDSIIPCHGDVIKTNGKERFNEVMKWYLESKDKTA